MQPADIRQDPGKWKAVTLTVLMHALLLAALFFGIRWQNRGPEPVSVELWQPPPAAKPVAEAPPPPAPEAPAKIEPPAPPKPEIAVKAPEPKKPEVKKPEPPKPEPKKPEPKKAEAPRPSFDEVIRREQAQLDRDRALQEKQLRAEQEAQALKQAQADQAAAARARGLATYTDKIKGKIRGNVVLPPSITGNPVAIFIVTQIPSGEVIDVQKKRSSGIAAYDEAIDRAIRKSSPLPKPDDASLFQRQLELTFCPDETRGCR